MNAKEFTRRYYTDRRNTNCIKWDAETAKGKLPVWIADTDFRVPEEVTENLKKKLDEGTYGYGFLPEDYFDRMISWNEKISGITYKKEWIRFSKGAIDGLNQLIRCLTEENDAILINTPVYHPFSDTIKSCRRRVVESPLTDNDGLFEMDFKDIERKIRRNRVKMMILCTPHNPVGRVWTEDELKQLFAITHKYHVIVISDEVHSELIMPGHRFIPSLSFSRYRNEIITLNAESKTFSLALFSHCHVIIPNRRYRALFDRYQKDHHCDHPNAFNGLSSYFSYGCGEEWLEGFNQVIFENYQYMKKKLEPYCVLPPLEGSYLVYADFSRSINDGTAYDFLYNKCAVYPNPGEIFGKGYEKWARFNLATSLSNIRKLCRKIEEGFRDMR
ncbi:MAG: aminotransferase class I/II-fold pyridoxal phosphate-dependent enzyme [Erysipelotrichaceae bacterium]|nr:aminotransferase class I/II-fold pyridoxal phosphate-dependent enzyme [Erysipelotrichaceae bacterium]